MHGNAVQNISNNLFKAGFQVEAGSRHADDLSHDTDPPAFSGQRRNHNSQGGMPSKAMPRQRTRRDWTTAALGFGHDGTCLGILHVQRPFMRGDDVMAAVKPATRRFRSLDW